MQAPWQDKIDALAKVLVQPEMAQDIDWEWQIGSSWWQLLAQRVQTKHLQEDTNGSKKANASSASDAAWTAKLENYCGMVDAHPPALRKGDLVVFVGDQPWHVWMEAQLQQALEAAEGEGDLSLLETPVRASNLREVTEVLSSGRHAKVKGGGGSKSADGRYFKTKYLVTDLLVCRRVCYRALTIDDHGRFAQPLAEGAPRRRLVSRAQAKRESAGARGTGTGESSGNLAASESTDSLAKFVACASALACAAEARSAGSGAPPPAAAGGGLATEWVSVTSNPAVAAVTYSQREDSSRAALRFDLHRFLFADEGNCVFLSPKFCVGVLAAALSERATAQPAAALAPTQAMKHTVTLARGSMYSAMHEEWHFKTELQGEYFIDGPPATRCTALLGEGVLLEGGGGDGGDDDGGGGGGDGGEHGIGWWQPRGDDWMELINRYSDVFGKCTAKDGAETRDMAAVVKLGKQAGETSDTDRVALDALARALSARQGRQGQSDQRRRKGDRHLSCPHGRRTATCKECGGSAFCAHGRIKYNCKDCKTGEYKTGVFIRAGGSRAAAAS
jgi:hypothetical protein